MIFRQQETKLFYSRFKSHTKERNRRVKGLEWDRKEQKQLEDYYDRRNKELDSGRSVAEGENVSYMPGLWGMEKEKNVEKIE